MKEALMIFIAMMLSFSCLAQRQDRIEIKGNILVPAGFEAGGVTIFNRMANEGAVSSENGNFTLRMAAGDTLTFSAVHFKQLELVVDEEVIQNKALYVEITEGINELPEIVLKDHNLTGNIATDIEKIEVEKIDMAPFYMPNIKDLIVQPDSQTTPGNAAISWENSPPASVDFIKVANLVTSILFQNRKSKGKQKKKQDYFVFVDRELRSRYDVEFFLSNFGIESVDINDFISFCESNGLSKQLLKEEKELDLIQFLVVQSQQFRSKR